MYETFVERGIMAIQTIGMVAIPTMHQYDQGHPGDAARRNQIQAGDRIAIKKMLGHGATEIRIRAIGIVKDNDHAEGRVYVNWLLKDMERKVPAKGCLKTIHGPFATDDWIGKVFRI